MEENIVNNENAKKWANDHHLSESEMDEIIHVLAQNYYLVRFEDMCKDLGAISDEQQWVVLGFLIDQDQNYDSYIKLSFSSEWGVDQPNVIRTPPGESMRRLRKKFNLRHCRRENDYIIVSEEPYLRIRDSPEDFIDDTWKHYLHIGPRSPASDLLGQLRVNGMGEMQELGKKSYFDHVLKNMDYYEKMAQCMKEHDFIDEVAGLNGQRLLCYKAHHITKGSA